MLKPRTVGRLRSAAAVRGLGCSGGLLQLGGNELLQGKAPGCAQGSQQEHQPAGVSVVGQGKAPGCAQGSQQEHQPAGVSVVGVVGI